MTAVWDGEVPERSREADPSRRRAVVVVIVLAAVIVGALLLLRDSDRPEVAGEQAPSPPSRVRGPGTRIFFELETADGSVREGWPPPMIARDDELVCFGFGRTDFRPPIRPTLARCVETDDIPELSAHGLVTLMSVQAGTDTWHVVLTGAPPDSVELREGDTVVEQGRVHIDDDIVALRLRRGTDLSELSWITGRTRVTCSPPPGAAESGRFCPTTDRTAGETSG